jgi:hypothetical protein
MPAALSAATVGSGNLLNREGGLDALGDSELLVDLVDWREPDAAMPELPERELAGISGGFAYRAIRPVDLEEGEMCARINQQSTALQAALIVPGTR